MYIFCPLRQVRCTTTASETPWSAEVSPTYVWGGPVASCSSAPQTAQAFGRSSVSAGWTQVWCGLRGSLFLPPTHWPGADLTWCHDKWAEFPNKKAKLSQKLGANFGSLLFFWSEITQFFGVQFWDLIWRRPQRGTSVDDGHGGLHRPFLLGGHHLLDREHHREHRPRGRSIARIDVWRQKLMTSVISSSASTSDSIFWYNWGVSDAPNEGQALSRCKCTMPKAAFQRSFSSNWQVSLQLMSVRPSTLDVMEVGWGPPVSSQLGRCQAMGLAPETINCEDCEATLAGR